MAKAQGSQAKVAKKSKGSKGLSFAERPWLYTVYNFVKQSHGKKV
jgi:hypothetical protein